LLKSVEASLAKGSVTNVSIGVNADGSVPVRLHNARIVHSYADPGSNPKTSFEVTFPTVMVANPPPILRPLISKPAAPGVAVQFSLAPPVVTGDAHIESGG